MGILNNIWIALSTPNENLTNVLLYIACFFENYLIMDLFISFLNVSYTRMQKIKYTLLMSLISILTMTFIPEPFYVFINYFFMVLLITKIFKLSILKSIFATFSSVITFGLIGSLCTNPYLILLHITTDQLIAIPVYRFGFLLTMYTCVLLINYIIKYRKFKFTLLEDIDKKTKFAILANIFLGLLTLIIQCIIIFFYTDILPLWITFLSFISLLFYIVINIYSLTRVIKLTLTTRKLESAESYNTTLRILHDNVREFKHDFDNIVTTIGGYIKTEDIEGLKKYYVQLEDDCEKVNNLYILNPEIVNNDGIYNLLTKKYNEAESKNIKINISFLLDLSSLHMKIYEFARILGILLDNAIDASSECEEKILNLSFRNDTKNSRELIVIENTYKDKNINTEKIFEKGVSGKENHTEVGLWEVRKIIKKNNNVNLHTSKNDKFFSQTLEIYY